MSTTEAPQYQATWIECTGFRLFIAFLDTITICLFICELHIFFKSLVDFLTRAHAGVEEIECNSQKLWRQAGVQSSHTYNTLHKESMHEFILWGNSICKHHVLYVWCAHNERLFPYIAHQLWSHEPLQTFCRTNHYMHLPPSMSRGESNRWYWKATRCTFHFTKQMLHNRCFQGLEIPGCTKRPDVRLESIGNICKKLWTHVVWCANHLRVTSLIRHLPFLHSKS